MRIMGTHTPGGSVITFEAKFGPVCHPSLSSDVVCGVPNGNQQYAGKKCLREWSIYIHCCAALCWSTQIQIFFYLLGRRPHPSTCVF